MLVGTDAAASAARLQRAAPTLPTRTCATLARRRRRPASRRALEGGTVYTDDKAPVEWLVDKSIVEYAADGE